MSICRVAKSKKSNTTKILAVLAVLGVGAYLWLRSQLRFISFSSLSIPFQQFKDGRINLGLSLPIINASALAANVTGFSGFIVTPSGATIATVFLAEPAHVARFQQSNLRFTASIRLSDLLTEAGGMVVGGSLPSNWGQALAYLKNYKLRGQLRVYGLPLPIEIPLI